MFVFRASQVTQSVVVATDAGIWSSAPGQAFLIDTLTIENPTARTESLSDFVNAATGLSNTFAFVLKAANAANAGYSSDCTVDPAYSPTLCPISFGQGLTVVSDSASKSIQIANELTPGTSVQLELSYGPVLSSILPADVSVYFHSGTTAPVELAQ